MNKQSETHASRMPISIKIGGVAQRGHYLAQKRMVRVDYVGSSKPTQLGGRCWCGCSCPTGNVRTETFSQATERFSARHSGFLS
jgi:hypothetical protein